MKTIIFLLSCITCGAATFQELIDDAGPVLTLAPGVYRGPVVIERDLVIQGGPGVEITVDYRASAVTVPFDFQVSISGVTFRDGYADSGAGILNFGSLTVSNCIFTNNATTHDGGAIKTWDAATISDCVFVGNSADYGGALYTTFFAPVRVENCMFENNKAYERSGNGGAVYIAIGSLVGCTIRNNSAIGTGSKGGGVNFAGTVTVKDTTICGNWCRTGPEYSGDFTDEGGNTICSSLQMRMIDDVPRVDVGGLGLFDLQAADSPLGPWETLTTDTAPFSFSDSQKAAVRFYRIVPL